MAHLAICLLGTFHITRDSTPITEFASNKVRGLIAYLAVESDRPHTRETLAALFWPDYSNTSALTNLRNTLANLRRVIGDQDANPTYLLITNETVQFNRDSDYGLDVTELVQLAGNHHSPSSSCQLAEVECHTNAANCYRGPFLAGFSIPDSIAFEEWTSLWRERLGQIALEELRWLAGFYEARGEYTLALEYARRQVALDPWLEEGQRLIMRILAITGQRGAALTQYDTCKRVLANDLGVDPADETRRLYAAICAGQIETLRPGRVLPAPGEPPYRGLCFFDEPDAAWFFGRELLTARLAALVEEIAKGKEGEFPLLAIVGASGSGKSSLVRAGVVPLLRKTGWEVQVITPSNNLPAALEPGRPRKRRESHTIRRHLLVIDQFEELFSLVREENERLVFLNRIFEPNLPILLVLRADFYGHCAPYPRLRSALSAHQEYIGAMDASGLRRAIEEPARRGGWELEPGLSDLLLQDIGAADEHPPEPGALPLLEHALLETWFRRRGRVLTLAGYAETGGVRQAIARTAERVYDSLSPGDQVMARRVFLHLTELGEGTQGTRRRASFSELRELAAVGQVVDDLLSTLAKARLVTLGEETAEVAHEALIREWPALQGWLAEDRDGLRLHRHITESAATWERLGRDPGEFYRGANLAQALEWARQSEHWQDLTLLEDEFLQVSREHEELEAMEHEAQRQRELEFAQQFAEAQRQRAEEREQAARELYQESQLAYARELAAHSKSKLNAEPDLSLLLALEAVAVLERVGLSVPWDVQQSVHDVALAS
ncbi:MAG: hypothetical protein IH586_01305, partial [Anaerolineaceae bacterium]|nr:hypothetical protein [Anaerolineaceae bacterium]